MQDFTFKHYQGPQNRGDLVWAHPNQRQVIVIDGVSGALPEHAAQICRQWLDAQLAGDGNTEPEQLANLRPEIVISALHQHLLANKAQAVFGMATRRKQQVSVDIIGNLRIYEMTPFGKPRSLRQRDTNQPEHALGQTQTGGMPIAERLVIDLNYDRKFLFCSDGLDHQRITDGGLRLQHLEHGVRDTLHELREEEDWSAVVFPVDHRVDTNSESMAQVIIGEPSTDIAEHAVHQLLAEHVLKEPALQGSKLIRNPFIKGTRSSREIDALFVTPLGLFFIEVKGHAGDVELYVDSTDRNSLYLYDRNNPATPRVADSNPIHKCQEAIRDYQKGLSEQASEYHDLRARKSVVVCFTSTQAQVACIDRDAVRHALPYRQGEVVICDLKSLVQSILNEAKQWCGKRLKPQVSREEIDKICMGFQQPAAVAEGPQKLLPGLEFDANALIAEESTDYFKVYRARHYQDEVWAKRYISDSFKQLDGGAAQARIAREIPVLQRLGRHRVAGIPYYYWHYSQGADLIVFLEPGHPTNLLSWLEQGERPQRHARISVIQQLASTLHDIAQFQAPSIVLRSINPKNIRLACTPHKVDIQLINFELIQSDDIKTLPVTARTHFDRLYQAAEVLDASAAVTSKADVYSFAMVCALVLGGKPPNKVQLQQRQGFRALLAACALPESDAALLTAALHPNPQQRPDMARIYQQVSQWT
ncbi:NERD domain-containing protein kinase family protein [Aliidiomarina maris]|uniref:Nuclease-like protein n=1 Tax=Aliidiomarina maris TaxID=531312 RepID=A0A327WMZ7_9GAMM|nr:NERD domain-containing protein kinase family protein [Aliidiomarina maris]RAJ92965.1 nuclease-like protein [Aliidiomarina maris]RUO18455.1 hypothetical protein CWE07_13965 [Aliidiomarina maris]